MPDTSTCFILVGVCLRTYLVTVQGVLGGAGGDGDCVWLAAHVALTVQLLPFSVVKIGESQESED